MESGKSHEFLERLSCSLCLITQVPLSSCFSCKLWNSECPVGKVDRSSASTPWLGWSRLRWEELWQWGKSMPELHFNLKDLLMALFVANILSAFLNTVQWSISGTVSILIMSFLLEDNAPLQYTQAFDFNISPVPFSLPCLLPKYCAWNHYSQNETISTFPKLLLEK